MKVDLIIEYLLECCIHIIKNNLEIELLLFELYRCFLRKYYLLLWCACPLKVEIDAFLATVLLFIRIRTHYVYTNILLFVFQNSFPNQLAEFHWFKRNLIAHASFPTESISCYWYLLIPHENIRFLMFSELV